MEGQESQQSSIAAEPEKKAAFTPITAQNTEAAPSQPTEQPPEGFFGRLLRGMGLVKTETPAEVQTPEQQAPVMPIHAQETNSLDAYAPTPSADTQALNNVRQELANVSQSSEPTPGPLTSRIQGPQTEASNDPVWLQRAQKDGFNTKDFTKRS